MKNDPDLNPLNHDSPHGKNPSSLASSLLSALIPFLAILFWSLWFGGMMTLFVSVEALFTLRRPIAGDAASAIFLVFARYQLILGGLTLIFAVLYYGQRPSGRLIPHMETLREQYLTRSPEFARLHGISMGLFTAQAVLVFLGGIFLCISGRNR